MGTVCVACVIGIAVWKREIFLFSLHYFLYISIWYYVYFTSLNVNEGHRVVKNCKDIVANSKLFYRHIVRIFIFSVYEVILGDSDTNILTEPKFSTMKRCSNNIETIPRNDGIDLTKRWQCPTGSFGRYVYLYLINPTYDTELCEIEVYAQTISSSSTHNSKYSKSCMGSKNAISFNNDEL